MKTYQRHISSLGASANIIAMLAYLCLIIIPNGFALAFLIVLLFVEKKSGLVKYAASQCLALWAVQGVLNLLFAILGSIFSVNLWGGFFWGFNVLGALGNGAFALLQGIVGIVFFIFYVMGAVHSYNWRQWEISGISALAHKIESFGTVPQYNGNGPVPKDCELSVNVPPAYQNPSPPQPGQYGAPAGTATPTPNNGTPGGPNAGQPYAPSPGQPPVSGNPYQPVPPNQYNPTPAGYNAGSPHGAPPADTNTPLPAGSVYGQPAGTQAQAGPPKNANEQLPKDMRDSEKKNDWL